jgi:hypothetical protein
MKASVELAKGELMGPRRCQVLTTFFAVLLAVNFPVEARTNSYFSFTGDRVMINIQSGHTFTPVQDDDAIRLYDGMNVLPENSVMGKGKKISMREALTLIVADRGRGAYDGTIMLYQSQGIRIDGLHKIVEAHWTGADAEALFQKFNSTNSVFDFVSADGKLRLRATPSDFHLDYREVTPGEN